MIPITCRIFAVVVVTLVSGGVDVVVSGSSLFAKSKLCFVVLLVAFIIAIGGVVLGVVVSLLLSVGVAATIIIIVMVVVLEDVVLILVLGYTFEGLCFVVIFVVSVVVDVVRLPFCYRRCICYRGCDG